MKRTPDEAFATDRSPAPNRSLTQRLDALERANEVRRRRAALKKDLKAGRISIDAVLRQPPDYVETAKVMDMLLAVPSYGRVKVNKVLTQCRISPSKTIGGLSERQRDELVKLLRAAGKAQPPPRPVSAAASHWVACVQPDPSSAADEELARELERLIEEARRVGRLAGRSAREAGDKRHASAPRPDAIGLQAGLRRTLAGELAAEAEPVTHPLTPLATTLTVAASTPARISDEHSTAVQRANEIRLARAELKREISEGTVTVSEVILACPREAASMTIGELLTSQRRWGATRCSKLLAAIGMPGSKTLGSMTERQRALLASMV